MDSITPWRQIVAPHDNIKQGMVRQNVFAASLADVLRKDGNRDYHDPERFFNRTFLTEGLRNLAGEVVGRLTGKGDGDAVMQIQTPFGGGKTHTLIALYHLVKNGKDCFEHPNLKAYWEERGWSKPPDVPVAAFDGNQIDMSPSEVASGISVRTMWGHIAWQLAGKAGLEIVREADENLLAPGGEVIDRLLQASGGGLIILDEVANYVENAAGVAVKDSTLAAQTRTFLQRLTTRAGIHERVVVAATLPRSDGTQTHGPASLEFLQAIQGIFGRVQKVREPVQGGEVHEIIRRRLFLPFGHDTEDKGARTKKARNRDATIEAYVADLGSRPQIPDDAGESTYVERFRQSYPFHPYFLDILHRYLGTNPKFQKTRGVLRLLALVVADLLKKKHDGGLIHASDIDLVNEEIRSELRELVDHEFRAALEADIIGAGANAIALDRDQSKHLAQWRVASGVATTTFLFTCEAGNGSKGATLAELHLASARPEIDFATIPNVVQQMKERFHFINADGERFRFSTTPNLNRILLDAKHGIDDNQVRERLKGEIHQMLASGPLAPYLWPDNTADIADSTTNKLVVMPLESTFGPSGGDSSQAAVLEILEKSGSSRRIWRNTLVFLVAEEQEVALLRDVVRRLLAAENVDTNRDRHNLSATQIAQLQTERNNTAKGVKQQILRTYRHAAWGGSNGEPLKLADMGQPSATADQNLTDLVIGFLKDRQKYLERIASALLVNPKKLQVWPEGEEFLSLKVLPEHFRSFTHLPILRDDEVLREAIVEGVRAGHFALCEGTSSEDARVIHFRESLTTIDVPLDDGYLLLRPDLAERKIEAQGKSPPVGSQDGGLPLDTADAIRPSGDTSGNTGTREEVDGSPIGGAGAQSGARDSSVRRVQLDVEVPFADFHTFHASVINALGRSADGIKINVQVEASAESGFSATLIEDTIKETLYNMFGRDDILKVEDGK